MGQLIRLSKTGIEYADYAWNFASGCGNNVDGKCKGGGFNCWAYSITQRFGGHYPNGFKPTIYLESLFSPLYLKNPSRILCVFMGDLFWDCPEFNPNRVLTPNLPNPIPSTCFTLHGTLRQIVFGVMRNCPQHTFIFLTKQPQHLIRFSPYPENCWIGFTATNPDMFNKGLRHISEIKASVKFVSLEPLLDWNSFIGYNAWELLDWTIIGAQSPYNKKTFPKWEWIEKIIIDCDKCGTPVFLKNNLRLPKYSCEGGLPFYKPDGGIMVLRQELPK